MVWESLPELGHAAAEVLFQAGVDGGVVDGAVLADILLALPLDAAAVEVGNVEGLAAAVDESELRRIAQVGLRHRHGRIAEGVGAVGLGFVGEAEPFLGGAEAPEEGFAAVVDGATVGLVRVHHRIDVGIGQAVGIHRREHGVADLVIEHGELAEVGAAVPRGDDGVPRVQAAEFAAGPQPAQRLARCAGRSTPSRRAPPPAPRTGHG